MKKRIIGSLITSIVGAIVGGATAHVLYPALGNSVFILAGGLAVIVGLIGGSIVLAWVYWD
jgi:hypothetical protein